MRATSKTRCVARSWMPTRSRKPRRWYATRLIHSTTCAARLATSARWRGSGPSVPSRSCSTEVHSALDLELLAHGSESSPSLLFLHDLDYLNHTRYPFVESLGETWRVLLPSHPGFGNSPLPDHFDSIDDLAYFYLDML